ncbi:hypothetical protein AYO44_07190 [Planctomycetaceae bacterium SCGC AG-212-F19]|nr:hypothetical protein AYO44_07190 [Planctomycetaceae bacterium SCGC AG-212-F19]
MLLGCCTLTQRKFYCPDDARRPFPRCPCHNKEIVVIPFGEAEWLLARSPEAMLVYLLDKGSARKLRLLSCAVCRRIDHLLTDPRSRQALQVAEQYADKLVGEAELTAAFHGATAAVEDAGQNWAAANSAHTVRLVSRGYDTEPHDPIHLTECVADIVGKRAGDFGEAERNAQGKLIQEVFGNPFRPYPAPSSWPGVVIDLAQALYDGHGDRLILADALEEAGHTELAEHFRAEEWHPKGCWVVDLVLGKK